LENFISKLPLPAVDHLKVLHELSLITKTVTKWEPENQIGLKHRPGCVDQWKDGIKSLYNSLEKKKTSLEHEYSIWNDQCPPYTRSILEDLSNAECVTWGRVRFMLARSKTGLSMHTDAEPRYHLVLSTNINAIFGECFTDKDMRTIGYHIPADGHWYKVDTTREHFVYNGGWEPRIHLVACPVTSYN